MKKKAFFIINFLLLVLLSGCSVAKENTNQNNESSKLESVQDQKDEWTVTQYGPRGINSTFYTIHNPQKGLIVIDGGWPEDAQYVKDTISTLGGHVDMWILSHPHQDHVGAFNTVYQDLGDITISEIYTVDMATPDECLSVASWDSVDAYNTFLGLGIPELKYLYADDTLEFHDLEIEVLSTYDGNLAMHSRDYLNDGSMMFKVNGETESFLFCSDVGPNVSDYILQKCGEERLKADYIQMGHHGYGGLKDDFYQAVSPKIAFFDAPDALMKDETGKYDNPENAALMESMGSEVISFNSAPNSIVLK